jgi:glutaredoxin
MAKEFFEKNNIPFVEKDVAEDDAARDDMIKKSGQMGVPVIDIDGTIIVGFNKPQIVELLKL